MRHCHCLVVLYLPHYGVKSIGTVDYRITQAELTQCTRTFDRRSNVPEHVEWLPFHQYAFFRFSCTILDKMITRFIKDLNDVVIAL